jgi:hypothetical protein
VCRGLRPIGEEGSGLGPFSAPQSAFPIQLDPLVPARGPCLCTEHTLMREMCSLAQVASQASAPGAASASYPP